MKDIKAKSDQEERLASKNISRSWQDEGADESSDKEERANKTHLKVICAIKTNLTDPICHSVNTIRVWSEFKGLLSIAGF